MNEELTPWFPADVAPARVGLYERDYALLEGCRDLWNGGKWILCTDAGVPFKDAESPLPWRGLASDPKVSKP